MATLALADALVLAHALVARVGDVTGTRLIVLKGVGAVHHGLREPRTSSDVDVLVPPTDVAATIEALELRGWRRRPADPDEIAFPVHSISLYHPTWPCDIDVHFRFPGLEAPPAEVFARLWARREHVTVAGRRLAIPSVAHSFVILGVHALRSPWVPRHADELEALALRARSLGAGFLLGASVELGAAACMRPLLEPLLSLESVDGPFASVEWGQVSDEWAFRTRVGDPLTRRLLIFVHARDWRVRLALLRLAVLPPREVFLKSSLTARVSGFPLLLAHLRRWGRGVAGLPRVVRGARALCAERVRLESVPGTTTAVTAQPSRPVARVE